jgi:hypothetical protein
MADVFISYSREDFAYAKAVADQIVTDGGSVWWDRQLSAGVIFESEIRRELKAAKCVVVIWTATSVGRDWVIAEAEDGRQRGILVPLQVGACELPLPFGRVQTVLCDDWTIDARRRECLHAVSHGVAAKVRLDSRDAGTRAAELRLGSPRVRPTIPETIDELGTMAVDTAQSHLTSRASNVGSAHPERENVSEVISAPSGEAATRETRHALSRPPNANQPSEYPRRDIRKRISVIGIAVALAIMVWLVYDRVTSVQYVASVWDRSAKPIYSTSRLNAWGLYVSSSGHLFATVSQDSLVRLWSVETGREIGDPIVPRKLVDSVEFGDGDSRMLTKASGFAQLWNTETGHTIGSAVAGERISFLLGGRAIGSVSTEDCGVDTIELRKWESGEGQLESTTSVDMRRTRTPTGTCDFVKVSPDLELVLVRQSDATISLWEARSGALLWLRRDAIDTRREDVTFSRDSKWLYMRLDGSARIWNARTGEPVSAPFGQHDMNEPVFSPDAKYLISRDDVYGVTIWRLATERPYKVSSIRYEHGLLLPSLSADGECMTARIGPYTVQRWYLATGDSLGPPLQHRAEVYGVWSLNGCRALTLGIAGAE